MRASIIILLLFTTEVFGQNLSESDIVKYVKKIDSLKIKNLIQKISFPDMSACGGGLDGYYYNDKLVYIDATYQAELGYSRRKMYIKDTLILKILYQKHFAEWEKYFKIYPNDKYIFDPQKMTYSDTLYTIIICNPISFVKSAKKKIISKNIDQKLIDELISCGLEMKQELETIKTNHQH